VTLSAIEDANVPDYPAQIKSVVFGTRDDYWRGDDVDVIATLDRPLTSIESRLLDAQRLGWEFDHEDSALVATFNRAASIDEGTLGHIQNVLVELHRAGAKRARDAEEDMERLVELRQQWTRSGLLD
jgi:cell division FtsZ-interacting protein ZapD